MTQNEQIISRVRIQVRVAYITVMCNIMNKVQRPNSVPFVINYLNMNFS